jgi:uncharacterized protein (DUF302 family)
MICRTKSTRAAGRPWPRRTILKTIVAGALPFRLGLRITSSGATEMSDNGLITLASTRGVKDTIDAVEADVKSKGMMVFCRVDHAAGAKEAGLALRPTLLLVFGNAKGGTPLMQADQRIGIDLPLKMLAWEDAAGKTWLTYNDPAWLAQRHGLGHGADPVVQAMQAALAAIAKKATVAS